MSHPPFMIIPQNATPYYPTGATPLLPAIRTPLLFQTHIPPPPDNNSSTAAMPSVTGKPNPQAAFKAPAHKHAHHLHSIPPREKSTRTLIIDHLLWVHSRTRFAQARAELGMTDRTGGSSSVNYVHRERPEHFEEEDGAASDSECVSVLRHRSGWSMDNEDARLAAKDPQLAKALRTRSESVEKVVASMLHQPPEVRPLHPDDAAGSPGSPGPKKPVGTNSHPHTLPNGVRLRAALATLINDFFARESHPPSAQALNTYLPPGIIPLLPICSLISEIPSSATHANHFARQHRHPPATPSAHALALFAAGIDPSTSPAPRCPRHLYTACTICVPPRGGQASRRPVVTSFPAGHPNAVTGWQDGSGIGSGLSSGPKKDDSLLRRKYHGSTNLVDLIGRFLKLSALVAMELGLEADEQGSVGAPQWNASDTQNQASSPPKGKGRAMSTNSFDPRSQTSSPAQQQNNPSPSEPESVSGDGEKIQMQLYALRPSPEWYGLCAGLLTRAVLEGYVCGGWNGLGALETLMKVGLGLRPDVLNVPTGDSPSPLVEGNGEGSAQQYHHHHYHNQHHHHDNVYEEFEPDDFPTIVESAKVLFPSLRQRATSINSLGLMEQQQLMKEAPEQEYEYDMEERLSRFYDVQPRCPDLLTHLEDISWQYPTEPLERAMLRFFEAISKWRGKPELENYKKKSPRNLEIDPSIAPLTMDALVHSSPIVGLGSPGKKKPQGPRIEKYFLPPPQNGGTLVSGMGSKRRRESVSATLDSATKRMRTQFDAFASMGTTSMGNTPMGSTPGGP